MAEADLAHRDTRPLRDVIRGTQGCRVAGLQGCRVTELQGYEVAMVLSGQGWVLLFSPARSGTFHPVTRHLPIV